MTGFFMTHLKTYSVPSGGDTGNQRSLVEHWIDLPRHILKCNGNELVLTRPPKNIDLLVIADPRYAPDVRPEVFNTSL